jgi:superfamily II DNA or RNA helicase
MSRLNFKAIQGTSGEYTEFGSILKIWGGNSQKEEIKRRLTVRNTSLGFRMKQIMSSVANVNTRMREADPEYAAELEGVAEKLLLEYKELQEQQVREYFEETFEGDLLVPPGLWYLCENIVGDRHLNTEVKLNWTHPTARDYQVEATKTLMTYKRATAVLSTGLGKSLILLQLCKNMELVGKRICVVVPTEELVKQMSATIGEFCDTTAAGGGRNPRPGANVLVTTAASAIKYIDVYDAVLVDEAHHNSAKTWENLLLAAIKSEYVYNLTATPFRTDGMDLGIHAFGGPIVFERDAQWGVASGWLAPLDAYCVHIIPKDRNGDPVVLDPRKPAAVAYSIAMGFKEVNDFLIKNILKAVGQNKKIMVLYKTVKAGQALKKILDKNGVSCGLATSQSKGVIKAFRENQIQVMISNDRLVGEGVDIPDADMAFNLIQNSSETTTAQVTGRILRKSPGKEKGIMIDVCVHGYGQFESAAAQRMRVYKRITNNITVIGKPPK